MAAGPETAEPAGLSAPGGRAGRVLRWRPWMAVALVVLAAGAIVAHRARSTAPSEDSVLSGSSGEESLRAIAVLPLENLSPDSSDAYLARVMTDEVTSALSVVPGFRVTSRTSASRFAGPVHIAVPKIADSLGVRYVVEGNVLRSGDSVAVTARLVDGRADRTLWTGRFASSLGEALHIHVDIARNVAASLRSSFTREAEARIEAGQTSDPVARGLYLRAEPLTASLVPDSASAHQAVDLLRRAVSLDSSFAAAWLRLGRAYQWVPNGSDSARIAFDRAVRAARLPWLRTEYRALRAEYLNDRDSALALSQQAVRLNPGNPELIRNLAEAYKWRQDLPNALVWERKARDLDPLNAARWDALGFTYLGLYLDRRAERAFRRAVALDPADEDGWSGLANLRTLHGDYRAALALEDTFDALTGAERDPVWRGQVYLWMGDTERGRELLEKALANRPWKDAVWIAPDLVHARLLAGDTAAADSLALRAEATLRHVAATLGMSPGMPAALVELAAVRGEGAEAARRLRDYARLGTPRPFRWLLEDPDFGSLRSDTAFRSARAELRARVMGQRQDVLHMLDREGGT